ncbi:LCP family protein [Boudabousia tangfeifanii]|uniref:LCP family protein n=1 Tax=Boudabousia tangfeifanii TaxID=1912795 RepID=UPI0014790846|nr:LCP family protein [Boudabousia tangfeifanii]
MAIFAIAVFLGSFLGLLSHRVAGGIRNINLTKAQSAGVSQELVDPSAGKSLTFLLVGVDSREGAENTAIGGGGDPGARSDTTIVVKIAADRKSALMASVPRDALVNIPECVTNDGKTVPARRHAMFNSAFAYAYEAGGEDVSDGIACTVATFKKLTDVPLDGVVVADFAGFEKVVNAIGGVNVCLADPFEPEYVNGFKLPAGKSHLNGTEAIQFVRARKGIGDGSDTQRQIRQQYFLRNAWHQLQESGILYNPGKAIGLLDSVKGMLQFSDSLADPMTLAGLGYSLRNMPMSAIESVHVPFHDEGPRVVFDADAEEAWKRFLPSTLESEQPSPEPGNNQPAPGNDAPAPNGEGTSTPEENQGEEAKPDENAGNNEGPAPSPSPEISEQEKREQQLGLLQCH